MKRNNSGSFHYALIIPYVLDELLPSIRAIKNIEKLEEERRLFYVACNRVKERLIITMPSYASVYNSFLSYPCRFIAETAKVKYSFQLTF